MSPATAAIAQRKQLYHHSQQQKQQNKQFFRGGFVSSGGAIKPALLTIMFLLIQQCIGFTSRSSPSTAAFRRRAFGIISASSAGSSLLR
jgi:hypothetical protein